MNEKERAQAISDMKNQSRESLRPAPSDPSYKDWAGRNGVKQSEDQHYGKAKARGEVK